MPHANPPFFKILGGNGFCLTIGRKGLHRASGFSPPERKRMTHLFCLLLASISVSLLLPVPAKAQPLAQQTSEPNAETATPQGSVFTKGLLWKIEAPKSSSPADTPDYLFGTMHSDDPQITTVPEKV